jgi:hypothetical protein
MFEVAGEQSSFGAQGRGSGHWPVQHLFRSTKGK